MHVNQLVIVYSSGLVVLVVRVNIYILWCIYSYWGGVYGKCTRKLPLDH